MARHWIVLTAARDPHPANEIVAYTEWDGYQAASDEVVYTDPEDSGGDAVDAAWRVGGSVTFAGGVYTYVPPGGVPSQVELWIGDLADAYQSYLGVRTESWVSRRDGADARTPMVATDRWAYAQIALGDVLARSIWLPGAAVAERVAGVAHIVDMITRIGAVWYGVMTANVGYTNSWSGASIADNAIIYSDIINDDGSPRDPDGMFLSPGLVSPRIAAAFNPDTPTLR